MARKPVTGQNVREASGLHSQMQQATSQQNVVVRDAQAERRYFIDLYGTATCPECFELFSLINSTGQPVQEGCCKHVKCRRCLITNQSGCLQCHQAASRRVKAPPPAQESDRVLRSSRHRSTTSFSAPPLRPSTPSLNGRPAPTNGFRHPSVLPPPPPQPPISYASQIRTPPENHVPSTISSSACLGLGLGSTLTNGFHHSTPTPPPDNCSKRKSRRSAENGRTLPEKSLPPEQFAVTITPTDFTRSSHPELPVKKRHSPAKSLSPDGGTSPGTSSTTSSSSLSHSVDASQTNGIHEEDALDDTPENHLPNESCDAERKTKKKRNPVTIYDHISIVSGDPLLYQCGICMKKFKTKAHIKYHEFCQNGRKPFKCQECGQGFIAKSHFEYHIRTHTGERPYTCPKCGKGFNQRGKVTRHMRSHTGEKPFVCPTCGRGFANTQAMRSHLLIHTGERPFSCDYCDKRFTGMTNLKKHVITHTGERPFMCTHCGKSFGLKWTLDLHLRTHSSERPFACDQCSRAFSNSKDLRRHMVIHSGERPFKCWICTTAFRRKDNLDRHIKNTHNQPKEVAKQLANEAAAEYLSQRRNAAELQPIASASDEEIEDPAGSPTEIDEQSPKDPLIDHASDDEAEDTTGSPTEVDEQFPKVRLIDDASDDKAEDPTGSVTEVDEEFPKLQLVKHGFDDETEGLPTEVGEIENPRSPTEIDEQVSKVRLIDHASDDEAEDPTGSLTQVDEEFPKLQLVKHAFDNETEDTTGLPTEVEVKFPVLQMVENASDDETKGDPPRSSIEIDERFPRLQMIENASDAEPEDSPSSPTEVDEKFPQRQPIENASDAEPEDSPSSPTEVDEKFPQRQPIENASDAEPEDPPTSPTEVDEKFPQRHPIENTSDAEAEDPTGSPSEVNERFPELQPMENAFHNEAEEPSTSPPEVADKFPELEMIENDSDAEAEDPPTSPTEVNEKFPELELNENAFDDEAEDPPTSPPEAADKFPALEMIENASDAEAEVPLRSSTEVGETFPELEMVENASAPAPPMSTAYVLEQAGDRKLVDMTPDAEAKETSPLMSPALTKVEAGTTERDTIVEISYAKAEDNSSPASPISTKVEERCNESQLIYENISDAETGESAMSSPKSVEMAEEPRPSLSELLNAKLTEDEKLSGRNDSGSIIQDRHGPEFISTAPQSPGTDEDYNELDSILGIPDGALFPIFDDISSSPTDYIYCSNLIPPEDVENVDSGSNGFSMFHAFVAQHDRIANHPSMKAIPPSPLQRVGSTCSSSIGSPPGNVSLSPPPGEQASFSDIDSDEEVKYDVTDAPESGAVPVQTEPCPSPADVKEEPKEPPVMETEQEESRGQEPDRPKIIPRPKRTVRFIYSNPDDLAFTRPDPSFDDSNLRIVYVAAAAQAEDSDEETGSPRKVRLLYAEALGYGGNGVDPPQFVYTSTTPNQAIYTEDQSIYAIQPRYVTAPSECGFTPERVQAMFELQPPTNTAPLPMKVVTHASGTSYTQLYADYPENLNIMLGAGSLPNLMPPNQTEQRLDITNVFRNYGFYQDPRGMQMPPQAKSFVNGEKEYPYEGTGNGYSDQGNSGMSSGNAINMLAAASEAKRLEELRIQSAINSAAAVAAVGEAARHKREMERLEYYKKMESTEEDRRELIAATAVIAAVGEAARTCRDKEKAAYRNRGPVEPVSKPLDVPKTVNCTTDDAELFKVPPPKLGKYHLGPRKHYLSRTTGVNPLKKD